MSSFMTSGRPHDAAPSTLPFDVTAKGPDVLGRFGPFGGRFVPETLMNALEEAYPGLCRGQVRCRVSESPE